MGPLPIELGAPVCECISFKAFGGFSLWKGALQKRVRLPPDLLGEVSVL